MSRSRRLRLSDLRDIYRLIGRCRDHGADPAKWREILLEGACELAEAPHGMSGLMRPAATDGRRSPPVFFSMALRGWADSDTTRCVNMERAAGDRCPAAHMAQTLRPLVTWKRGRPGDPRAAAYPCGVRQCPLCAPMQEPLISLCHFARDRPWNIVALYRSADRPPFSPRQVRMIQWLHHELSPLLGKSLSLNRPESTSTADEPPLSPRLRQVLECLLQGDSEKQLARRLDLGDRTAHEYVTTLYRRFQVNSRGELMSRFIGISEPERPSERSAALRPIASRQANRFKPDSSRPT